jgi:UDPglucose 6-dehydrogenase/UDP-N-acetyl-D-galactosamine dehydrogenase
MVQGLLNKLKKRQLSICIIGVGYVGYPLAKAFAKYVNVIGYDIDSDRILQLNEENNNPNLKFTCDETVISKSDVIIICVPTPVTKSKEPDLSSVKSASNIVGRNLKPGSIIILESTYYPGVTEEVVIPILENVSGLKNGIDFKTGYSPERINPGDKEHTINKITKIVAGIDENTTRFLKELYQLITDVYIVSNIKTAEAAKVIENIQRDLNIALINELALIMHKLDIDTHEVLDAAATKWNFHRYTPGLVGGHCIPVDPYYLVYKAKELGYHPQVILAGRSINDNMPKYIVDMTLKALIASEKLVKNSKVLIMGLTYKENIPDIRESPSVKIINELLEYEIEVYAYDPYVSKEQIQKYGAKVFNKQKDKMDCIIFTVNHKEFNSYSIEKIQKIMPKKPILIDVKGIYRNRLNIQKSMYYLKL